MENMSANVCPRVRCGKTTGKRKVCVTQLNSKQHCKDFVRMVKPILLGQMLPRCCQDVTKIDPKDEVQVWAA